MGFLTVFWDELFPKPCYLAWSDDHFKNDLVVFLKRR